MALALAESFNKTQAAFAHEWNVLSDDRALYRQPGREVLCIHAGTAGSLPFRARRTLPVFARHDIIVEFALKAYSPLAYEAVVALRSDTDELGSAEAFPSGLGDGSYFFKIKVGQKVLYQTQVYEGSRWYRFGWKTRLDATASPNSAGYIEWRVDDVVEARVEGVRTSATVSTSCSIIQLGLSGTAGDDYVEMCDLVVVDADGTEATDYLGDAMTSVHWPSRAGTHGPTTTGTGGFADVDDMVAGGYDGDATFVALAAGQELTVGFASLGTERGVHVHAARVVVDARLTSGSNQSLLVSWTDPGGSTVAVGTLTVASTIYAVIDTVIYVRPSARRRLELQGLGVGEVTLHNLGSTPMRITRVWLETVAPVRPVVAARAVTTSQPQFVLPDWSGGVAVTTTWLTDVTASKDDAVQDRLGLLGRPYRRCEAGLLGARRSASTAAQLAELRRGIDEHMGLLYSDVARLTADYTHETLDLMVDARFRRFYVGARVGIAAPSLEDATSTIIEHGVVADVQDDRVTVSGGGFVNDYPKGSRVYPVIDAEVNLTSEAHYQTDRVLDGRTVEVESPDGGVLPPAWTGARIGLFPERSSDGVPVFDAQLNWATAPTVSAVRPGNVLQSGKAYVQDLDGARPLRRFTAAVDTLEREDFWRVLCFTDWAHGRARSFWFVDPLDTFEVTASGSDHVDVRPVGKLADLQATLTHIAFSYHGIDALILDVASVTLVGDNFRITVSGGSPIVGARASPALFCRLSSDSLQERWITDEACQIQLQVQEVGNEAATGVTRPSLAAFEVGAPARVPDMACWFEAQTNCYDYDDIAGVYVKAQPWPDMNYRARRILDARVAYPKVILPAEMPRYHLKESPTVIADYRPYLARFEHQWYNKGKREMIGGPVRFGPLTDGTASPYEQGLWDNTLGMTIFVVVMSGDGTAHGAAARAGIWYSIPGGGGGDVFKWTFNANATDGVAQFYATPGTVVAGYKVTHHTFELGTPNIWMLRWLPGTKAQVTVSGHNTIWESSSNSPVMPEVANGFGYDDKDWFEYFHISQPASKGIADANFKKRPTFNALLAYRRRLTDAEANIVGDYLAKNFDVSWEAF